jgi:uncharacterized protein
MIPVKIKNRDNHFLFGILHIPADTDRSNICIVILSPGVKSRVAPHRLYMKMSRVFVSMGYTVLRFDFSGLGDSEGENQEIHLADLYNAIQMGKYVNDTIDVMNWLEKNHQKKQFVLAGLCGGAITGLHAGVKDHRVIALLALGMPVILDGNFDRRLFLTPHQLEYNRSRFLQKAFNLEAWKRFLFLRSDYKLLYVSFIMPVLEKFRGQQIKSVRTGSREVKDNLNPLFHPHFMEFAKTRKILLVFGESDKLLWDFQEKYLVRYRSGYENFKSNIDFRIIPNANHIMSFHEWTLEMIEITKDWLNSAVMSAAEYGDSKLLQTAAPANLNIQV